MKRFLGACFFPSLWPPNSFGLWKAKSIPINNHSTVNNGERGRGGAKEEKSIFFFLRVSSPHVLPREEAGERGTSSPEKANGMSAFPSILWFGAVKEVCVWGGADCWEKQVEDEVGPF